MSAFFSSLLSFRNTFLSAFNSSVMIDRIFVNSNSLLIKSVGYENQQTEGVHTYSKKGSKEQSHLGVDVMNCALVTHLSLITYWSFSCKNYYFTHPVLWLNDPKKPAHPWYHAHLNNSQLEERSPWEIKFLLPKS